MTKRKAPRQTGRFVAVTDRARRLLQGKPRAAQVYTDLLARSGPRASVPVRQSTVATALGVHVNTVKRAVQVLTDLGLVEVRRTRGTAYYWLPEHPGYAADLDAYEARKAANAAKKAGGPHMEAQHPHIDPQHDGHGSTTDCGSGTTTDCGSISIDVPSYEGITNRCSPPPGARPSGPSAPSGDEAGGADSARPDADQPTRPSTWAVAANLLSHRSKPDQELKNGAPAAPHLRKESAVKRTVADVALQQQSGGRREPPPDSQLLDGATNAWEWHEGVWYEMPRPYRSRPRARYAAERPGS